jgi:hypothetical protein
VTSKEEEKFLLIVPSNVLEQWLKSIEDFSKLEITKIEKDTKLGDEKITGKE